MWLLSRDDNRPGTLFLNSYAQRELFHNRTSLPMKYRRIARFSLIAGSVFLFACGEEARFSRYKELTRVTSPDSVVDAVLTQDDGGGATTPFIYKVFIVPRGERVPEERGFEDLRAIHVDSVSLRWREPKFLEIHYKHATISQFSNMWHTKEVQDFGYVVEIRLMPLLPWSLHPVDRGR